MPHERHSSTKEPHRAKTLLWEDEIAQGINVIIDDRFAVIFPMETRAQIEHLIRCVNLAIEQGYLRKT